MVKSFASINKFNYSPDHLMTMKMGKAYVNRIIPVLPGDTWRIHHNPMARCQALISPAYGQLNIIIHDFFVPTRVIWPEWYEGFLIKQPDGNGGWTQSTIPTITSPNGGWSKGSLADSMGYPVGVNCEVLAFKMRAYAKVIRDWYINQSIQDADTVCPLSTASGTDTTTNTTMFNVNWNRDYFTGCLPWRQRGDDVSINLSDVAVIGSGKTLALNNGTSTGGLGDYAGLSGELQVFSGFAGTNRGTAINESSHIESSKTWGVSTDPDKSGLIAKTSSLSFAIDQIRTAFQIKKKLEMDARGGARAVEYLLEHWHVRCSDGRLQRSEFLHGSKTPFLISEVLQTSSTDATTPQGNMAGHGFSVGGDKGYTKTFEEHGYIVSIVSIVPKAVYNSNGMPREDMKRAPEEFALPVLSHLSEDAVFKGELKYTGTSTDKQPLGYRPIYDDYRHMYSTVSGEFRDTLDFWTFARKFSNQPALNQNLIQVEQINRPFAVANQDQFLVCIKSHMKAYRKLPKQGLPGLIDHS